MAQINKPTDYFNTVLWSGDSTSSRNITGAGFQPDFVWQKCRSHAVPHLLYDSVRGAGNDKELSSNGTTAEGGESCETNGFMSAFISDGFTVAQGSSDTFYVNLTGRTYVGWNWLAGGTASSNTDGSITSTVSANTTSGFSIVKWLGDGSNDTSNKIGHGLGVAPKIIIYKSLSVANWYVWLNKVIDSSQDTLYLNTTEAKVDMGSAVEPTSLLISNNSVPNGENAIAYCFAEKKGFSKFGSYVGNGNADGPFVYTGFKPAWFLVKQSSASGQHWYLFDNKRDTFNAVTRQLYPSLNAAESNDTGSPIDFTSNGVKIRNTSGHDNTSGATYIYMAFAENPLVGTNNIPATAR